MTAESMPAESYEADAIRVLATVVPQAELAVGADVHQLVAWARPADHEVIEEVVGKLAERFIISLRLVDVREARVDSRRTDTFRGQEEQLIRAVRLFKFWCSMMLSMIWFPMV